MSKLSEKFDNTTEGISEQFELAINRPDESEKMTFSNYSYWKSTWNTFTKNKTAMMFLLTMTVLILFTVIQPFLPYQKNPIELFISPETQLPFRNLLPSEEFWMGTNSIGQDLWSRIWSGTRTSMLIGLCVGICNAVIGITIGALWGYVPKLDAPIRCLYNVIHNIPNTIALVLIAFVLRPGIRTLILSMCLTGWLNMAKFIRNQIMIIRDREYNLASRCLGTNTIRIITKNLLPYLTSVIMLRTALAIPGAIGNEVFLTYIGLGLPISIPSLGNLINEGRAVMMNPSLRYQLIFPALVLSLITISFYVVGTAFADASDPRNHV